MKRVVAFTGAGISSESGLKTFRDEDGLWEEYEVTDVATPEAWERDPELVLHFYNLRRKQTIAAQPNAAHIALAGLEEKYHVEIITQNIDDLHERAGSSNVLHLHGEIKKARSTQIPDLLYDLDKEEIKMGDTCEMGGQLRPHVVWFGETVPFIPEAKELISKADILLVIGTSLNVYPAAGLIHYCPPKSEKYLIDPSDVAVSDIMNGLIYLKENATSGVPKVVNRLLEADLKV